MVDVCKSPLRFLDIGSLQMAMVIATVLRVTGGIQASGVFGLVWFLSLKCEVWEQLRHKQGVVSSLLNTFSTLDREVLLSAKSYTLLLMLQSLDV